MGLLIEVAFGGIEPDELPAAMLEGVIKAARKDLLPGGAVRGRGVIVVADDRMEIHAEGAEHVAHGGQFRGLAMIREVTHRQTKFRPGMVREDAGPHSCEPGGTLVVLVVGIVEDHEVESNHCRRFHCVLPLVFIARPIPTRSNPAAKAKSRGPWLGSGNGLRNLAAAVY